MPERKFKTPEELEKKIDEFIKLCESGEIPRPTDYRLCEFLGISIATLERYYTNANNSRPSNNPDKEDIYKGFDKPLKKLIAFRADRLEGIAEANPKAATPAIFLLKQGHNGGYTDRQIVEQDGNVAINLTIKGADGKDLKR